MERVVVKQYGRDSILFAAVNPVMTAILVGMLGMKGPLQSDERIALAMEKDAASMARQGYRIVSTREYRMPLFGVTYQKMTYELADPRRD